MSMSDVCPRNSGAAPTSWAAHMRSTSLSSGLPQMIEPKARRSACQYAKHLSTTRRRAGRAEEWLELGDAEESRRIRHCVRAYQTRSAPRRCPAAPRGPADNDAAILVLGGGQDSAGPSSAFIDATSFEDIACTTVIVSDWVDGAWRADAWVEAGAWTTPALSRR